MTLRPLQRSYLNNLRFLSRQTKSRRNMDKWLIDHTRHPKDPQLPWSFEGHEYQIQIVTDDAEHTATRKPAQVGASEIQLRITLALAAVYPHSHLIYTLPSADFAKKFSTTRIDPVIEASPDLSAMIDANTNNTELKKILSTFVWIRGTFGKQQAISVPASILVRDEVDFSDPDVLKTFYSRLQHEQNKIIADFSTPTSPGVGISDTFDQGSQHHRYVYHWACNQWVYPDPLLSLILPAMDGMPLHEWEASLIRRLDDQEITRAYWQCPHCKHEITVSNFDSPDYRAWVPSYENKRIHSYQVAPFDVPAINTAPAVVGGILNHGSTKDWINFSIGKPAEDAQTSFLEEAIMNCMRVAPILPDQSVTDQPEQFKRITPHTSRPGIMGIDTGKINYLVVGYPVSRGGLDTLDVVYMERIKYSPGDSHLYRIQNLARYYNVRFMVIDALPDYTLVSKLIQHYPINTTFACYYSRSLASHRMGLLTNEEEATVKADRTLVFNKLAKQVNQLTIGLPRFEETRKHMLPHLRAMKRIGKKDNVGEMQDSWVSTNDDHYAHALNYARIALDVQDIVGPMALPVLPMMRTVKLPGIGAAA